MCILAIIPQELNKDLDSVPFNTNLRMVFKMYRSILQMQHSNWKAIHFANAAHQLKTDPFCKCSTAIKNTVHCFLHCHSFQSARNTFHYEITNIERAIIGQDKSKIIQAFLYVNTTHSSKNNKETLDSVNCILDINRFDQSMAKKE